jgi:hypothetical protein
MTRTCVEYQCAENAFELGTKYTKEIRELHKARDWNRRNPFKNRRIDMYSVLNEYIYNTYL